MNNLQIDIKPVLQDIKGSLLRWMPDSLGSIYFFPDTSPDPDTKCYYFLVFLERDPESLTLDFWVEYYKNVEVVWDRFWIEQSADERIPILSINFRSLKFSHDPMLTTFFIEESPVVLYENFEMRNPAGASGPDTTECEMIWI